MAERGIAALIITSLPDVRYLTGFTGSNAAVVVTSRASVLVTDGRYSVQARAEVSGARVRIAKGPVLTAACELLPAMDARRVHFDPDHTSVAELMRLRQAARGVRFVALGSPLVPALRMVKDAEELDRMRSAARLGCRLFNEILPYLQPEVTEIEIAARLEYAARRLGAEGMSFETIIASGDRSALPHGHASRQKLPRKGFVTLDFGVILKGYCSDMTRTVHMGKAGREERAAYDAVLEAEQAGVLAVRAGAACGEVDEAARCVLRRAGLAKWFTHSTGHGVGLEIHEGPRIAAGQQQPLAAGMVVTIEPGVYLPGRFGIRIEDMVTVAGEGAEVLTDSPRALIEL